MEKITLPIQCSKLILVLLIISLLAINCLVLLGTYWYVHQLDLGIENVLAVWYSSMVLLIISFLATLCYLIDNSQFVSKYDQIINFGWLIFTLIFATLSLSEMGSLHENFGYLPIIKFLGRGDGWFFFYVLIGLVGLFMLIFTWFRLLKSIPAIVFSTLSTLLFLSIPIQEKFELTFKGTRPRYYLLLEEGSELFGSFSMIIALTFYIIKIAQGKTNQHSRLIIDTIIRIDKRKSFFLITITILALGFLMFSFSLTNRITTLEKDQLGIAKNWFPSSIAFITSILNLYLFFSLKTETKKPSFLFLFLGSVCLFTSMYYGSNWYELTLAIASISVVNLIKISLTGFILLACFWLYKIDKSRSNLIFSTLWALFSIAALYAGNLFTTELCYLSTTILLVSTLNKILQMSLKRYSQKVTLFNNIDK